MRFRRRGGGLRRRVNRSSARTSRSVAQRRYISWMKLNEPFIYRVARRRLQLRRAAMGEVGEMDGLLDNVGDMFNSLTTTVSNLAPQYLQFKQQKQVMDMQIDRAKQGLPPANVEDYAPVIKIAPTITPETEQAITRAAVQTTKTATSKMLPLAIGAGVLGLSLLMKKR